MGPATQDLARRIDERTLGANTTGKYMGLGPNGSIFAPAGLDYPRATLLSDSPRGTDESCGDRAFSYDYVLLNVEISHQAPGAEGPAR